MSARKPAAYAILMGDIVGSADAPSLPALHRAFNSAIAWANKKHAAAIASPLTITLGDEFQALLTGLGDAWELSSALRLRLLGEGVSCRFVLGMAALETPLNRARAWNMMGQGLAEARLKLNDKGLANAHRFSFPQHKTAELLLDAVGDSLTLIESEWTATQLQYFSAVRLSKQTNAKVSQDLGVSERTLYKVLRAAHADFYERQSAAIRQALAKLNEQYGLR